jgi:hypothetical protein
MDRGHPSRTVRHDDRVIDGARIRIVIVVATAVVVLVIAFQIPVRPSRSDLARDFGWNTTCADKDSTSPGRGALGPTTRESAAPAPAPPRTPCVALQHEGILTHDDVTRDPMRSLIPATLAVSNEKKRSGLPAVSV